MSRAVCETVGVNNRQSQFYITTLIDGGFLRVTKAQKKMAIPKVGLFACFSGGSNSGSLTGMAALEVVRRLGNQTVGICSLPAILNQVPRQSALIKQMEHLMVIDGCHNACAKLLLADKGIVPDVYLNLEENLHQTKQGPFSSLAFTDDEVKRVADAIVALVNRYFTGLEVQNKRSNSVTK
jgi:uncharacterized metal-binding protein